MNDFTTLKGEIEKAALQSTDENARFVVECDASYVAILTSLNQYRRPVAFISSSLHGRELHCPAIEKEATAIIEAVRTWSHFLARQHFTLITDQLSVAFMLDNRKRTKIKNNKIKCWRLELASYSYSIQYRPGKDNGPDALTRAFCANMSDSNLVEIHVGLCPVRDLHIGQIGHGLGPRACGSPRNPFLRRLINNLKICENIFTIYFKTSENRNV